MSSLDSESFQPMSQENCIKPRRENFNVELIHRQQGKEKDAKRNSYQICLVTKFIINLVCVDKV